MTTQFSMGLAANALQGFYAPMNRSTWGGVMMAAFVIIICTATLHENHSPIRCRLPRSARRAHSMAPRCPSVRTDPVAPELIDHLLALADQAPSVGLSQPWRFVAMATPEQRARVIASFERCNAEALESYETETRVHYGRLKLEGLREAPVQFAVFADEATAKGKGLGRRTMGETARYSVVCAVHTLWLVARAFGLGVGWVSVLEPEEVRRAAGVPEDWSLVAYLCIGWPCEEHVEPELERAGWEHREAIAPRREAGTRSSSTAG